jgi:hypothetical protein
MILTKSPLTSLFQKGGFLLKSKDFWRLCQKMEIGARPFQKRIDEKVGGG